jgi:hypothetical protein
MLLLASFDLMNLCKGTALTYAIRKCHSPTISSRHVSRVYLLLEFAAA